MRGLAVGQRHFGRFTLTRLLGRGGMGVVWLAHDESLSEEVALKFLPDVVRWDPAAIGEMRAETRRARQLTHPNIVRIHDLVEDSTGAAIAMEFIDGRTLTEERLARPAQVLEPADILPWLDQLAAALDYAHREARVVHRDIKPSNVMLTRDGRVKVTDFGVARALGESMLRVSQIATTGGTLLYMSPQQALGELPTARDDIYAFGATLYELLTGKPPFHSGNVAAQIERRRPDSVAERRRQLGVVGASEVPEDWEQLIAACLAKQPEDRPASVSEAVARLGMVRPRPVVRPRTHGRRGRVLVLSGVAMVFAMLWWWARTVTPTEGDGAAARATAWPSDAARAWAAWNFDGDSRESSGRGWGLRSARVVPTQDRFGRIDRALQFNGVASLQREIPELIDWSASEPFSVAVWVREESHLSAGDHGTVLVSLRNDVQGDLCWRLQLASWGVSLSLAQLQVDNPDEVVGHVRRGSGRWNHVAAVSNGAEIRVYLDGAEVGRAPIRHTRAARFTAPPTLSVGLDHKFDLERFAGAMDDLRLWRRALSPDEVAQLASPEPAPRFLQTNGAYASTDDVPAAVEREFGPKAMLADWHEVKRWHSDDTELWCEDLRIPIPNSGPLLQKGGHRFSKETRHYFLNRFDGEKPEYFLVHEELGGMRLALGSWHGLKGRALARVPFVAPAVSNLRADDTGDIVRRFAERASVAPLAAILLEWNQEVRLGSDAGARLELVLRDGQRIIAICAPTPAGHLGLALGTEEKPEVSRQLTGAFGVLRFSLVVREGQLSFRAISPVGANIVFSEVLRMELAAQNVSSVTLRGVDSAVLTVEE